MSLALIDADRFKWINDNHGHPAGDAVLKEMAVRITKEVRSSDTIARLGGDEFVVLFRHAPSAPIDEICERMTAGMSASPVRLPHGGIVRLSISCGLARLKPTDNRESLVGRADQALYSAKAAGRNRMVAA